MYKGSRRSYYVNGKKVKPIYSNGCRPKLILKKIGVVIKFKNLTIEHNDLAQYNLFSTFDKRYIPKLIYSCDEFSVHEYVKHKKLKWNDFHHPIAIMADNLAAKYYISDHGMWQFGIRKDSGKLVYFDYGA